MGSPREYFKYLKSLTVILTIFSLNLKQVLENLKSIILLFGNIEN